MQSQLSASTYRGVSVSRSARGEVGGGEGGVLVRFCLVGLIFLFFKIVILVHYSLREIRVRCVQPPQEQLYPFLKMHVQYFRQCGQTLGRLQVFGIFNTCTDVDACECTRGLYGHRWRAYI